MKLQMAPNSVFAILLRQPWWAAAGVAVALSVVSAALLPQEARAFGMVTGIPFAVVAAVAWWRQRGAPSPAQVRVITEAVAAMGWPEFSALLVQRFGREGYEVRPIDGGADLLLARGSRTVVVSARRWKAARLGEETLQGLLQAQAAHRADECICVALGEPGAGAVRLLQSHRIALLQGDSLARLLRGLA